MDILGLLKGYKMIIATIGAVALFITVVCQVLADGFQFADVNAIMQAFIVMMGTWGATAKLSAIEKTIVK